MNTIKHCAVEITAELDHTQFFDNLLYGRLQLTDINLTGLKGVLFSQTTINRLIEEEVIHDHFEIITDTNSTLKSMSSGEQKKALLKYIISRNPGFIVVDNLLDNLDIEAQASLLNDLKMLATIIPVIQIINRQNDILPFIENVYIIKNEKVIKKQSVDEYFRQKRTFNECSFSEIIPSPLQSFNIPDGPLIQLDDISVSYDGRQILDKIKWTINPGEFWQITGPNGSGKSTLLNLITGDNPKGYGQNITLFGKKKGAGETIWEIKQNIGYITPTMTQLFFRMESVEKMVVSGFFDSIGLYIIPSEMQLIISREWLKIIGLFELRNKPFSFLSLVQQRMVLAVRAMVKHPPLLILDEPASGLDDYNVKIFTSLINKIAAESNTAILYVSHRTENGLTPQLVYELIPGTNGSAGRIRE